MQRTPIGNSNQSNLPPVTANLLPRPGFPLSQYQAIKIELAFSPPFGDFFNLGQFQPVSLPRTDQ